MRAFIPVMFDFITGLLSLPVNNAQRIKSSNVTSAYIVSLQWSSPISICTELYYCKRSNDVIGISTILRNSKYWLRFSKYRLNTSQERLHSTERVYNPYPLSTSDVRTTHSRWTHLKTEA